MTLEATTNKTIYADILTVCLDYMPPREAVAAVDTIVRGVLYVEQELEWSINWVLGVRAKSLNRDTRAKCLAAIMEALPEGLRK